MLFLIGWWKISHVLAVYVSHLTHNGCLYKCANGKPFGIDSNYRRRLDNRDMRSHCTAVCTIDRKCGKPELPLYLYVDYLQCGQIIDKLAKAHQFVQHAYVVKWQMHRYIVDSLNHEIIDLSIPIKIWYLSESNLTRCRFQTNFRTLLTHHQRLANGPVNFLMKCIPSICTVTGLFLSTREALVNLRPQHRRST